ncbi:hypothetical protein T484DRAFT_1815597 [Baffinella frigidus]|nr:hypothetical protein T484DRAFT_1815597 [Cryptophyta sp. CCMP2293]
MHAIGPSCSQACLLLWSKHKKEIISFPDNQLTVWKYPSMTKVSELAERQARVLYTVISSDGNTVVSATADQTLKLWKVAEQAEALEIEEEEVEGPALWTAKDKCGWTSLHFAAS